MGKDGHPSFCFVDTDTVNVEKIKLNRTPQYHLPELRGRQIFADIHR